MHTNTVHHALSMFFPLKLFLKMRTTTLGLEEQVILPGKIT
jgi:hypothetical protein